MKRLKGGPELKLPELKMPLFLLELYYDLRDRRLLPLVALALVAIVAVPFLLSGGSDEKPAPPVAGAAISSVPGGSGAELTVVRANPGLRDYRKRLQRRSSTDPFRQKYTAPNLSGAQLGSKGNNGFESSTSVTRTSTSVSSGAAGTTKTTKTTKTQNGVTTTETKTESAGGTTQPSEGSGASQPGSVPLYTYAIDVRIKRTSSGPDGKPESSAPVTRSKVIGAAPLPGEKAQVVTYIGASPSTHKPLFIISGDVTAVFGEGKCLSGATTCQLMELEVGMPVTFVYGPDGARYKFTVLKTEPVVSGHS